MIYKLLPNRVRRTYKGGNRIDTFEHTVTENRPEDWTASVTLAQNGDNAYPDEGIGTTEDGIKLTSVIGNDEYPILVKLLDADERLVVQAHPTVEFSKEHLKCNYGKTECWYFLDCDEGACVYAGFKPYVSRAMWEEVFRSQDIDLMLSYLNKIQVNKGDFLFIPGGLPHAIGKGCFMIELQEPSDLMVVNEKFTPSGRKISQSRLDMNMGEKLMFDVYRYNGMTAEELKHKYMPKKKQIEENVFEILGKDLTDKFSMYELNKSSSICLSRRYAVIIVISGEGIINGTAVKKGERLLFKDENIISAVGKEDFSVIVCT